MTLRTAIRAMASLTTTVVGKTFRTKTGRLAEDPRPVHGLTTHATQSAVFLAMTLTQLDL